MADAQFRNLYDSDVTTISPQGRIFQVEYAAEAVKQGAASVGAASRTHVVLVALKRSPAELASYQRKLIPVDNHIGVAISGLTSDARVLSRYMQAQALSSRMHLRRPIPVQRLVADIADKAQALTQEYGGRPFGVGLLVAGFDATGPHLFEFGPAGTLAEFHATAIGARSQSARTSLEKRLSELPDAGLESLVAIALGALRDTLPPDASPGLTAQNTAVGYVSATSGAFVVCDEASVASYLSLLPAPASTAAAEPAEAPMVTDAPASD